MTALVFLAIVVAVSASLSAIMTGAWFAFSCSAFADSYCRYMKATIRRNTTTTIAHTHQLLFFGGAV